MNKQLLLSFFILLSVPFVAYSQGNQAYRDYISKYKDMAIEQMQRYHIPASITLAQGLLESGAGKSTLATKANNHFGIKVSGSWNGPYVLRDDDARNEKFRKYNSVADSYEDHSRFLLGQRYRSLFTLPTTDYRAWAKGLKQAGYATSPTYAESLIKIIEDYKLYQYDGGQLLSSQTAVSPTVAQEQQNYRQQVVAAHGHFSLPDIERERDIFFSRHTIHKRNDNYYFVIQQGDTWEYISLMTGVSKRKLRRYNDLSRKHQLQAGEIIYMGRKHSKADKLYENYFHTVSAGESIHSIAQTYGMKVKTLIKNNKEVYPTLEVRPGDLLLIR